MKFRITIFLTLLPFLVSAQESTDTSHTGFVTVRSRPSAASVYIDSAYAGTTPLERLRLTEGEHDVRVFYPLPSDWNAFVQQKSFRLNAGNEIEMSFEFGTFLTVHSIPSGALVSFQGTELGRTPLFHRSAASLRGNFTLEMNEYKSVSVPIQGKPSLIRLEPVQKSPSELTIEYSSTAPTRKLMTIGSAAGMIVSGVAAAYFKDRANSQFEQYSSTGDPAFLSSTHRYDRLSLVSLIITQATFALLTYSLLWED